VKWSISWLWYIPYLIFQSWLDGPKWLIWWLYQSYCNPAFMICFIGFACHFSFLWFFSLIIAFSLALIVLTWADSQCSIKQLTEAYNDIVSDENYLLHPVDNSITKSIQEFSSLKIYEKIPLFAKNFVAESPWYRDLFKEPLCAFVAEDRNGKTLPDPKAYTNFRGSSLVFLPRPFNQLDAVERFFLLHELEHVNLDGAMQLSRRYSRPLLLGFNIILLGVLSTSWWHWLIIIIYMIFNLLAYVQATGKREVIADNGALLKLSNTDEQKEVVDFLIELSSSYLQNKELTTNWMSHTINFTDQGRNNLIRQSVHIYKLNFSLQKKDKLSQSTAVWMDRLLHFRWYEYRLQESEPLPFLGWTSFYDTIATVPFSLFFLYLGVITISPPIFPFVIMFIYMLLDMFWLQFWYLNQLVEISNSIGERLIGVQNNTE
jgi:hypothetical protein